LLGKAHRENFSPSRGSFPGWPVRLDLVDVGSRKRSSLGSTAALRLLATSNGICAILLDFAEMTSLSHGFPNSSSFNIEHRSLRSSLGVKKCAALSRFVHPVPRVYYFGIGGAAWAPAKKPPLNAFFGK
jgi:hypothetical protein